MNVKRISIIVPVECFDKLETCLRGTGVHGLTVTHVRGFGEHANFYQRDLLVDNIRVDIYTGEDKAEGIIDSVINFQADDFTHTGLLAVESVERLVNLRTGEEVAVSNL
jgi:nitrogen regulatory protein P-II 1